MIELRRRICQELSQYGWVQYNEDLEFFALGHPEKPYILDIHISFDNVRIYVCNMDGWNQDFPEEVDSEIVVSAPRDILTLNDKVENIIMQYIMSEL